MKRLFVVFISMILLFSVMTAECFAAGTAASTVELTYKTDGKVNIQLTQSTASSNVQVFWLGEKPQGLEYSLNKAQTKLTFVMCSDTEAHAGEYQFTVGSYADASEPFTLIIRPKKISVPDSLLKFEYNSTEIIPLENADELVAKGCIRARNVGSYEASLSLPDNGNFIWADGTTTGSKNLQWQIYPKAVKITGIKAVSKICDGSSDAEFDFSNASVVGLIEGDDVCVLAQGAYNSPKVGSGKPMSFALSIGGNDGENYVISEDSQSSCTGAIYRAEKEGYAEYVTDPLNNYRNGNIVEEGTEILDLVLNEEERSLIKSGADIKVWLSMEDITENAPAEDLVRARSVCTDSTVGAVLDINIFKQYGTNENAMKIAELDNDVTIEFEIPRTLVNKDKDTQRTYQIVRVHGSETEAIQAEYDRENGVLRFSTDRFSTYVLVYSDSNIFGFSPDVFYDDGNYVVLYLIGLVLLLAAVAYVYLKMNPGALKPSYTGRH